MTGVINQKDNICCHRYLILNFVMVKMKKIAINNGEKL